MECDKPILCFAMWAHIPHNILYCVNMREKQRFFHFKTAFNLSRLQPDFIAGLQTFFRSFSLAISSVSR